MLLSATLFAGEKAVDNKKVIVEPRGLTISHEVEASHSAVFGGKAKVGDVRFGSVNEQEDHFSYVASPQLKDNLLLRVGVDYERYSYGLPSTEKVGGFMLPLPNTLQSTAMVVGADWTMNDQWIFRIEAQPGIYSDFQDVSARDVNVPFIIGGSYLIDKDLQWFMGVSVDLWREYPVLPGAGVRWKFAEEWTLFFVLPKPRIQYEVNERVTLFVGANIKSGTYRVEENFGRDHGRTGLNNAIVEYTEIRTGAGVEWQALPFLNVTLEGGYVPSRTFDYSRANTRVKVEGAPYVELAASAKF